MTEYYTDEKDGPFKTYYENGKLKTEGTFIDGKMNGLYKSYHENGKLQIE